METLRIGQLAARTGCPVETVRYYERAGLLRPLTRSTGNYRLYASAHIERIAFIRHCRSLDMSLDEIRTLLRFRDSPEENCDGVNQLLESHIRHVAARIADLGLLARELRLLRRRCRQVNATPDCGILNGIAAAAVPMAKGEISHVRATHARKS